jgi:integrase
MNPIRVWAVQLGDRPEFVLRWRDPVTGRRRQKTTNATKRGPAEREAAHWAEHLAKYATGLYVPWHEVRKRYTREVLAMQAEKSGASWETAIRKFEQLSPVDGLHDVTSAVISSYTSALLAAGLALSSIQSYLRELRRCLRWAAEIWPTYQTPRFRLPRVAKHDAMKGRPITTEEFERMLAAVPKALVTPIRPPKKPPKKPQQAPKPEVVESWRFLLRGLWHSALRLGEALAFSWDDEKTIHVWGLDDPRPMFRVLASSEKGRRDRLLPMTPQFAGLLRAVPRRKRRGRVFRPRGVRGRVASLERVSAMITHIGKMANVAVSEGKWASAQDLRRAFAARLAHLVHPMQLMELMRHESLETTMRYYVGIQAIRTANDLWRALETESCDKSCDTPSQPPNRRRSKS